MIGYTYPWDMAWYSWVCRTETQIMKRGVGYTDRRSMRARREWINTQAEWRSPNMAFDLSGNMTDAKHTNVTPVSRQYFRRSTSLSEIKLSHCSVTQYLPIRVRWWEKKYHRMQPVSPEGFRRRANIAEGNRRHSKQQKTPACDRISAQTHHCASQFVFRVPFLFPFFANSVLSDCNACTMYDREWQLQGQVWCCQL
jgi:hypothetical protein